MNNFQVEFYGQAAHSSFDPWNGRSALDAVELMNDGANLMREHVLPSTPIHYVIPSAGEAPNVVPEYARVWYYVRDVDREKVQEWYDWLLKIAEGAAMGTRTTHEVTLITGVHAYNLNRPLQEALQANMEALGEPEYPEAFHDFARQLQAFLGIEQKGLNTAIKPLADGEEEASGGSTDVAEVSRIVPTAGINVTSAAWIDLFITLISISATGGMIPASGDLRDAFVPWDRGERTATPVAVGVPNTLTRARDGNCSSSATGFDNPRSGQPTPTVAQYPA
ncbi:MAG: peptidase dimerization domain-containing protein, partial [Bacteroidetes bacterium]|nr:peptidase dimerization domain-containing protein [Bacteroidota bacterium]